MKNLDECNAILQCGFPTDEKTLKEMPFGTAMLQAINVPNPHPPQNSSDPESGYQHRKHIRQIVESMNLLLNGQPRKIIRDETEHDATVLSWLSAWRDIAGFAGIPVQEQKMWRLEAYLHDVGKSLTHSKHPTRGQYLITQLNPAEREAVIEMLGEGKKETGRTRFDQIEKIVAFHDRFGVLSTGEASFGILADTLERGLRKEDISRAKQVISHIMVLNLVDIDASVSSGLISEKVDAVLDDWKRACWNEDSPLVQSKGDRVEFEKQLLDLSSNDAQTIARIVRLLNESYLRAKDNAKKKSDFDKSIWPELGPDGFRPHVQRAIKPLQIHWDDFRMDLAYVVKIDYALYFTIKVVESCWKEDQDADKLAGIFIKIIEKLVDQFTSLIRQSNRRLRIGVDLSVLRDTPEVQEQIAHLLNGNTSQAELGLEWLVHEASAWPFV